MDANTYKRHLLNHMVYSHGYLAMSQGELSEVDPQRLCEMASHAMACCWAIVDYHLEDDNPNLIAAEAWDGIANRWVQAVTKWSKQLPPNRAAAYAAPIKERGALSQWPTGAQATDIPTTRATRSPDATATHASATGVPATGSESPATSSTGASGATRQATRQAQHRNMRHSLQGKARFAGHDAG